MPCEVPGGRHDEYQIARTDTGYAISDKVAGRDGSLTLSNIQKVSFSDLSSVDLSLPNAMPLADSVMREQTTSAQPQIISAATLLANDQPLNSSGPLRISALSEAKGATVSLTEQGDVEVVPEANYSGVISFKYGVVDAAGKPPLHRSPILEAACWCLRRAAMCSLAALP